MLMKIRAIQKPIGQLQILVHIYRNERVPGENLKRGIGLNPKTASNALSNLEELKLIRKLSNDIYKLTKKGRDVAERLDQVEKLMSR